MTISLKALDLSQANLVASVVLEPGQEKFAGGSVGSIFQALEGNAYPWALHPFAIMDDGAALGLFVLREGPARPSWASADAVTLHSFRISRPLQGKGYGTAALTLACRWIETFRPGIARLMLTVNADNPQAGAFYMRRGFQPTGLIFDGRVGRERVLSRVVGDVAQGDVGLV